MFLLKYYIWKIFSKRGDAFSPLFIFCRNAHKSVFLKTLVSKHVNICRPLELKFELCCICSHERNDLSIKVEMYAAMTSINTSLTILNNFRTFNNDNIMNELNYFV